MLASVQTVVQQIREQQRGPAHSRCGVALQAELRQPRPETDLEKRKRQDQPADAQPRWRGPPPDESSKQERTGPRRGVSHPLLLVILEAAESDHLGDDHVTDRGCDGKPFPCVLASVQTLVQQIRGQQRGPAHSRYGVALQTELRQARPEPELQKSECED